MSQALSRSEPVHAIRLTVNGRAEALGVSPRRTLLHALREDLHLTGTKEGCGVGTCGACTVLVDGRAVLSCLMLAVQADGHAVETIEGLAAPAGTPSAADGRAAAGRRDAALDPLQRAFIAHDAFQCGFCTPGQIMALRGLLRRTPHPAPQEIRRATESNVCRCGAYLRIQRAALDVARSAEAGRTPAGGR
jgi:aerobic-type carbon monoxide dehydrogenase small subunit (CoxS/CutS family)